MKKMWVLMFMLCAQQSFAAQILAAGLDEAKENIIMNVIYAGGCGTHEFSIRVDLCNDDYPLQCRGGLIETTRDTCEAMIEERITLPLAANGLTDARYKGALLTILGDPDLETNRTSKAVIQLP